MITKQQYIQKFNPRVWSLLEYIFADYSEDMEYLEEDFMETFKNYFND